MAAYTAWYPDSCIQDGKVKIEFRLIGSACWILEIDDSVTIACDPALAPAGTRYLYRGLLFKRVKPPLYNDESFSRVDLWLLTHNHFDHLDRIGLAQIQSGSGVVAAGNCRRKLRHRKDLTVRYPAWMEEVHFAFGEYRITVTAVPASHGRTWFPRFLLGRVNGYLITVQRDDESKTVYVSSDTVYLPNVVDFLHGIKIDLFIPNMGGIFPYLPGGPYTMDMKMLDRFVEVLQPGKILPIHIDDFSHFRTSRDKLVERYTIPEHGIPVHFEI